MKRTQVQFTDKQLGWLRERAAQQGVSLSGLVRRAVDELIEREPVTHREERWERALSVAGAFAGDGAEAALQHDEHLAGAYGSK